jgi:dipeptidyl aminopeptidase/acylaminoacyl peptidase
MQVLTGEALLAVTGAEDPGDGMPDLGLGRGVFTSSGFPSRSGVWAVGPGDGPARAIAVVTSRPPVFDVVDLSPDGSAALLRAGTLSVNSPDPECVDLYSVLTDGSGATRLTPFRGGRAVSGAAFSPDGKLVAYSWWGGAPSEPAGVTVLDIASGRTVTKPCPLNFGFGSDRVEWSPSGTWVAILCNRTLTIFDASGTTEPVPFLWTEDVLNFGWKDDSHLMVATTGNDIRSFDVDSRMSTQTGRFDDPDIELVVPSTGGFSPDGRWLVFLGGERGSRPGSEFKMVEYLVPASGGRPIRILNENEAGSTITWSDGGEIVAAHETGPVVDGGTQLMLGRLDPMTLQWSDLGPLLGGQGIWQIP